MPGHKKKTRDNSVIHSLLFCYVPPTQRKPTKQQNKRQRTEKEKQHATHKNHTHTHSHQKKQHKNNNIQTNMLPPKPSSRQQAYILFTTFITTLKKKRNETKQTTTTSLEKNLHETTTAAVPAAPSRVNLQVQRGMAESHATMWVLRTISSKGLLLFLDHDTTPTGARG